MKNKKKPYIETSIMMKTAFLLLGNIFMPSLVASLGLLCKISINSFTYIIGEILLLIIYAFLFYKKGEKKDFIIPIIISFVIVALSILVSSKIRDNSVDGWGYHNPAIIKLSEGWNPIYEHFDDESVVSIWSEHYPKVVWLYGATIYKLTNIFFVGCTFNIIISFATLFLLIDIFQKRMISKWLSVIFGIIVTFGTVTVGQILTLYNDGVFSLSILGLLLLYNELVFKNEKLNAPSILIVSFYLSILANIKFNGALYAFIIAVVYSILLLVKKKLKFNRKMIGYLATIGFCVGIVASNTYITNIIYHKNIGYPLIGENKIEIIDQFVPGYINSSNGKVASFVKSFTSSSFYEYKYNPFYIISASDYTCAAASDCRVMGFGPWYQSLVILSGIFVALYIIKLIAKIIKKEETLKKYIIKNYSLYIPFLFMIAFFFASPATWWVRYIAFMFAIPALIILFFNDEWKRITIKSMLSYLIIFIYIISLIGIGNSTFKQTREFTNIIDGEVNYLKQLNVEVIDIAPIDYRNIHNSYRQNMTYKYLENQGIKFKKHETDECNIEMNMDYLAISIVDCSGDKK